MQPSFPKIFRIGDKYIKDLFNEPVEVTEKVDGSQFSFGMLDGHLSIRSKKQQLFVETPEQMFAQGIAYVDSIKDRLPENVIFYGEYLQKPKHNCLTYNRVPKNHFALFGVHYIKDQEFASDYNVLVEYSQMLDVDVVPILYHGMITGEEQFLNLLSTESFLGGPSIEGVVCKNYRRPLLLGGQIVPIMQGKYVSEAFKEVNQSNWKAQSGKSKWQAYKEGFQTEARWNKAVQHMKESGQLTESPQDIGPLMKEVKRDIVEEEKENIKEYLWQEYGQALLRQATAGLPEWYKEQLLKKAFGEN